MVYRIYVEKKEEFANEAKAVLADLRDVLGMRNIQKLRLLNRYDVENIDEALFSYAVKTVFSEPQTDRTYENLPAGSKSVFAIEYLPGQFDQRADSAEQCIRLISPGSEPTVRTAKVYMLYGDVALDDVERVKKYVINPVEARLSSLFKPRTLKEEHPVPKKTEILEDFNDLRISGLRAFLSEYSLAMDIDDIIFLQKYFRSEGRNPTITELRVIDTYWSDHCRHTTFLTVLNKVEFSDPFLKSEYENYLNIKNSLSSNKKVTLMNIATLGAKYLKKTGFLKNLDESKEINACTVKIKVDKDGKDEDWLLLFKNETHNHPTEIEPFGGAATCIGGAIRDPLSGRGYVYGAMRITGAANPLKPFGETIPGKLPQRKIVTTAAAGYSSYGNQIGLATGQVDEIYHDGYAAKHMEIGAVIAAVPCENVKRVTPFDGDKVILIGGRTGRDGCGGATGSSKSHDINSLEKCGAEVQKGNAPEERKLQRFFRNKAVSLKIKRCNDFGAGGVSVAIGELAPGLDINLDAVPKKYDGLDGTELAISESQERMAVVVRKNDEETFIKLARKENLEATVVATVKDSPRLTMTWNGDKIVDLSRKFLDSNGAEKRVDVKVGTPQPYEKEFYGGFAENMLRTAADLNVCSKRGLSERFDSTIGAGTVIMPFGGKNQLTPNQAMVQKISLERKETKTCSMMAWGFNPYITEKSPYHGAYLAVVESITKLIAQGSDFNDIYLTFQEYFPHPGDKPKRWGMPLAALLGALRAQLELKVASVGGKDSMSGTFENIDVPPTLVSFAVTTENIDNIVSGEFKKAGNKVILLKPQYGEHNLPETKSLLAVYEKATRLLRSKKAVSAYSVGYGGVAEAVMKMCFGNSLGFLYGKNISAEELFAYNYGAIVLEIDGECDTDIKKNVIGETVADETIYFATERLPLKNLLAVYEGRLEPIYPCNINQSYTPIKKYSSDLTPEKRRGRAVFEPHFLIPVFPGTNCEYDTAKAIEEAGGKADIFVINTLDESGVMRSVEKFAEAISHSHVIFIPGGFSGGDEPDGSGKFITAFFRNDAIKEKISLLLKRGGLMGGICNGFQALIKLGLIPYGKITDPTEESPTLTFNTISRHQSKIVRTRICSCNSPWLRKVNVGDIISVPISHGEGRFVAPPSLIEKLGKNGQIATQYVDMDGRPTSDIRFNPNNSMEAVEGLLSPDGHIFGKMGHAERTGYGLYKNVPGNYDIKMFSSAVEYFKL